MYRVKPPSKGFGNRQAFDIYEILTFADGEARGTIKRFWGMGNATLAKRSLASAAPPPVCGKFRCDSAISRRGSPEVCPPRPTT